jgi:hypothetical protein
MRHILAALVVYVCLASEAYTQQPLLSPRDSVFLTLDTNTISVNYGRPSMRGRKIMGALVPWDQVWRTGANEATHLRTNFDATIGGVPLPRGSYTLWTIPSQSGWKLIINRQTGQWGTRYDESQDLARFNAKVEQLTSPVDTFTIALEAKGPTSGVLKLMWENTLVWAPFEKNDNIRPISPLDSTHIALNGKNVFIKYSKPYTRGRNIWGVLVPYDSVWRTGANLATSLVTDTDLIIGGTTIPKGSYSLFSIPRRQSLTLIVNKKPGGVIPSYDSKEDLARIEMKMETATTPIDPFTIWLEGKGRSAAVLRLGWVDRVYSIDIRTK